MDQTLEPVIATIGTFDGLHLGHLALLDELKTLAQSGNYRSAVVTFDPAPAYVLRPDRAMPQLMTSGERVDRLRNIGIEHIILLSFTQELASLDAREFMALLASKYGVKALLIGYDHRFGRGATLSFDDYTEIGRELGISIHQASPLNALGSPISSSRVRKLLASGELTHANQLLGYPYRLSGKVVGGLQIGRSMGYPTANIKPDDERKLIPADGVYAVRIYLDSNSYADRVYYGMLYIGDRPTIDLGLARTIEVNIFGLSTDLYAQRLTLEFAQYIRGNIRFDSLEDLMKQIAQDEMAIRRYFNL